MSVKGVSAGFFLFLALLCDLFDVDQCQQISGAADAVRARFAK